MPLYWHLTAEMLLLFLSSFCFLFKRHYRNEGIHWDIVYMYRSNWSNSRSPRLGYAAQRNATQSKAIKLHLFDKNVQFVMRFGVLRQSAIYRCIDGRILIKIKLSRDNKLFWKGFVRSIHWARLCHPNNKFLIIWKTFACGSWRTQYHFMLFPPQPFSLNLINSLNFHMTSTI